LGAVGVVLGFWLLFYWEGFDTLGKSSLAAGALLLFASFVLYLRAKGYPAWWCLLFFFAGPAALFVFWFLPDRERDHAA
jgi:hypothetical protein